MDNLSLIENLDQAVDALLAQPERSLSHADGELASLLGIAFSLCYLPRSEFKEQLRQDLARSISMNTQAQRPDTESNLAAASPRREGFRTVTPYLTVADVPREIAFIREVFAGEGQVYGLGSAGGFHAECRIGDSMLMVGGGGAGSTWQGKPSPGSLHIYVPDVDAVYERALQAGATSLHAPVDQEYGERSAAFIDAGGNRWYPATAMGPHHILAGAQSLMPYLHPRGAAAQIEFLEQAFDAAEVLRHASPEGVIYHAKLRIGTSIVELGEAHEQWQPMPSTFMMYVDDVDAWYARAMRAIGAKSAGEPADQPYGDRVGAVTDPFGNVWYIASPIKDIRSY